MKKTCLLIAFLTIIGCKQNNTDERIPVEPNNGIGNGATPPPVLSFSENIEEAHNKVAFMSRKAVSFDIILKFGGKVRLDAKVSMTTNSTRVRLDKADGTTIVYNGNQVYITPDNSKMDGARFDIFTWQYFFAMPFKLTDPGTVWGDQELRKLDGKHYETSKLSFESNIGDSPDDWYLVYKDAETNRLKAAAYIVTFNTELNKAEKNPHAIVYSDYINVENIALATKWSFHNWDEQTGLGEQLGEAQISNIKFFEPKDGHFQAAENSKKVAK